MSTAVEDSAAALHAVAQPARRHRSRALTARLGAGAGLVACALGLGIIGGLGWGWLRPAYVGTVAHGGVAVDQVSSPVNVEFAALGWFSLLTAVIGTVLAAIAVWQAARGRARGGVGAILWLMLCGLAAAFAVYTTGTLLVSVGQQGLTELPDGEPLHVVPPVAPAGLGVAWCVGPFTAALSYWLANLSAFWAEEDTE
ncbi:hypothetical protein [Corynebacterium sp. p3-SID1056]|uniref:hypothetical protein n=1 Tax=Corynebacterium sp. p3-SID1056 TaxID=2916092 RepID=UPI0021A4F149|nr:hypothetical protein [Corynebacterium sp. p3-SID1056]MCT2337893.1 hypothetical protein [Corynebacterium sp. p3-SID1056]